MSFNTNKSILNFTFVGSNFNYLTFTFPTIFNGSILKFLKIKSAKILYYYLLEDFDKYRRLTKETGLPVSIKATNMGVWLLR